MRDVRLPGLRALVADPPVGPDPPRATRCGYCGNTGCIAEALRSADTQPGSAGALFELVMLQTLAGDRAGEFGERLRDLLGLEPDHAAA